MKRKGILCFIRISDTGQGKKFSVYRHGYTSPSSGEACFGEYRFGGIQNRRSRNRVIQDWIFPFMKPHLLRFSLRSTDISSNCGHIFFGTQFAFHIFGLISESSDVHIFLLAMDIKIPGKRTCPTADRIWNYLRWSCYRFRSYASTTLIFCFEPQAIVLGTTPAFAGGMGLGDDPQSGWMGYIQPVLAILIICIPSQNTRHVFSMAGICYARIS